MKILKGILKEELERLQKLHSQYVWEIAKLPKGCLIRKQIGKNHYCYLNYRNGKKSIFKYIGKLKKAEYRELSEKIEKRRKLQKLNIAVKRDIANLKRIIREQRD